MQTSPFRKLLKHLMIPGYCLLAGAQFACTTGDEDAINQRNSFRDEDTSSFLPTPQSAAEEARQYQKTDDDRKLSQDRKVDETIDASTDASTGNINDLNAAYAQILVPQGMEEQSYFAPVKGGKGKEQGGQVAGTKRRKPVFLGKVGVEALLSRSPNGVALDAPAMVTGGMASGGGMVTGGLSLAARASGRGASMVQPQEGMGTYIVRPGDTLSVISMHIYGTSSRWMELAHLNRLGNGTIIFPKELLLYIPDKAP